MKIQIRKRMRREGRFVHFPFICVYILLKHDSIDLLILGMDRWMDDDDAMMLMG